MKSSLSTVIKAAVLMMVATASVHAESKGSGSNHPDSDKLQWRQVADDVSASELVSLNQVTIGCLSGQRHLR